MSNKSGSILNFMASFIKMDKTFRTSSRICTIPSLIALLLGLLVQLTGNKIGKDRPALHNKIFCST